MLQFSASDVRRIRERARTWPGALKELRDKCEFFFTDGIKVPVGPASTWIMYFECPRDSAKLIYDYRKDHEYVCPVCGAAYSGEPYEGAWWRYTVEKVLDNAYASALIYMITGEARYLEAAREVLIRFADNYPTYTLHGGIPYNNPGRISSQTLCEAMALRSISLCYDVIRDALSDADRDHIERDLMTPSAQVLVEQRMNQIHNHEVVIDSSLGMAGLLLRRGDFVEFAVESKYGLRYQLTHGVLEDGFWFEGTVHYHYFALFAFMLFEKFAHGTPYSLMNMGVYERMLKMPLQIMQPDFRMPCLGDVNGEGMFEELAEHYEYPYRVFGKPFMAQLLNLVYAAKRRDGLQAFLFGADDIEPTPPMTLSDYHDDCASGLTVLRGSEGRYLLFKHGRYGGEHDHYDKLGIHFLAMGHDVVDDLGTVGYAAPHHYPYFKNTFTHNTVCIGGLNQPPADGRTIRYERRPDGVLVEGHADWRGEGPKLDSLTIEQWDTASYKGVTLRRTILWRDDYFVEAFLVRGAKGRTVDWVIHPQGKAELPSLPMADAAVQAGGSRPQSFLHDGRSLRTDALVETRWTQRAGTLRVFSACSVRREILYALGPNNPPSETLCYEIARVVPGDEDVVYMNVFAFGEAGEAVDKVALRLEAPGEVLAEVTVRGETRTHRFSVGQGD